MRRQALRLSQARLAAAVGVAANTVARWERGEMRVADPVRVSAVLGRLEGDLVRDSAAYRERSRRQHNLPVHLPPLIGRDDAVAEVKQRLVASETGLLTLTGTGGCGKTRLALQVVRELADSDSPADGIWLVELASLNNPSLLAHTVAAVLGVLEQPREPLVDTLAARLEHAHLILLLDNCEHLVEAAAGLCDVILRRCAGVRVLATSREPLRAAGEITWRVPSLRLPDPKEASAFDSVTQSPAVQLLVARAESIWSGFEVTAENAGAVVEVCERLDGLPLAIELAAARLRVLGLEDLRSRLRSCMSLLVASDRGAPSRHRTLRATLDWSYQLLTPLEQVIFSRLAVFAGGSTVEAIEAVCSADPIRPTDVLDVLTGLIDKSLVVKTEVGGAARYMQLETVRQYGENRLCDGDEEQEVRRRHADWCLAFVNDATHRLQTSDAKQVLAHLEAERDNIRAALAWCTTDEGRRTGLGLLLLDALGRLWWKQQQQKEGQHWIDRILRVDRTPARPVRVRALNWGAEFAAQQGDLQRSDDLADEALRLSGEIGFSAGQGIALARLGTNADTRGQHDRGIALLERALRICLQADDDFSVYHARYKLAEALRHGARLMEATRLIEDNLALAKRREDRWSMAQALCQLGEVASAKEEYHRAAELLEQSLSLWQATGALRGPHFALLELGRVALARGDTERARRLIGESLRICRNASNPRQVALCLHALASVAAVTGEPTRASTLFGAAAALGERVAIPLPVGGNTLYARGRAAVIKSIGTEAFVRHWDHGWALSEEQAVAVAEEIVATTGDGQTTRELEARLTARQADVLRLVAEGKTDRQIAAELILSEKTVGRHMENIFDRLGVSSRAAASVIAMRLGLA